jgi:hypothetical protein
MFALQCWQPVSEQHGMGCVASQPAAAAAAVAGSFPASTAGGCGPGEGRAAAVGMPPAHKSLLLGLHLLLQSCMPVMLTSESESLPACYMLRCTDTAAPRHVLYCLHCALLL